MQQDNPYREDSERLRELLYRFENLKNGRPQSFIEEESFEKIIEHYQEQDELKTALLAADMACEQYPYSALLQVKKADVMLALRRYREALDILDQASLLDARDINNYILKTEAYLALDQQEKAVELLEEAIGSFEGEDRTELLFELADVYDDYENFDKVFDCLRLVLEAEPTNEEALYKICFWTDFTGRNEEGIRLHQQIIDDYPYNELAWFNLAAAYQGLKLYEKAIDAYKFAITIEEKFDYAYRNMGDAYIRLRKYREAIEALEKVNEIAKPEDVIFEAIGYCYEKLKNPAQARFYYRKASHLRQDDSKLIYKIACTYFNEGQWQACFRQLETALKMHRNQPDYHLLAGECKLYQGQYREAIQYFTQVVRLRPRSTKGWEALTRCLFRAGFLDEALEQLDAALQLTGNKPLFIYYKAAVLFADGRSKEALIQLENALQAAPKLLSRMVALHPPLLQHQQLVDLLARYKRRKSI
ncbi:MAG: tetratricopeptide repeat protein [Chitinophagaceae bacterium]|nr:tetratricopeptide repeat protein [Chitinophagaceae bacterium]